MYGRGPLKSVTLHTIWGPPQISLSTIYAWGPPGQFFAYYMGPSQVCFCAYNMAAPSDLYLRILYGGPSDQFLRLITIYTCMGAPPSQFLRILYTYGLIFRSFFSFIMCHGSLSAEFFSHTMPPSLR